MPDEVREHLTGDQRPSSRITPDPSDSQLHDGALLFSSPHSSSTGFRSEDWNEHSRSLVLCSVTHFCVVFEVCVWIIVRLEDPTRPIIRFLTESVTYWFFICWYLIESMMPWSKQDEQDLQQKYRPTTSEIQHMGYFLLICIHQTHPECLLLKSDIVFSFTWPYNQSHLKFQSCLITEYAGVCFWMSVDIFSKPSQTTCGDVGLFWQYFLRFFWPKTQLFSAILQLWSVESL